MTAPVETIDFDAVFADITARLNEDKRRRIQPPLVRIWDGDWNLRGYVKREYKASFQWIDNDTGIGEIEMPLDYYLSQWITDIDERATTQIHITCDKEGARWSGCLDELKVITDQDGKEYIRCRFVHDLEHLKHILVYPNPFVRRPLVNSGGRRAKGLNSYLQRCSFQRCGCFLEKLDGASKLLYFVTFFGSKVVSGLFLRETL
ncbi:hypothetical protein ACFU44_00345 [Nocardia rhizosphaerihabitans]|uniref:Gp37-like protein n=1 Tax=Nocardia rhizosphaerihabitans TaxID=1691570 RepID=UPI003671DF5C